MTIARHREGEAPAEPKPLPSRRHPIHGVITDGHEPIIIFLTVCTKDRQSWLASPGVHDLLRDMWANASAWFVGRYVIMPDHIHLFAAPNPTWEGKAPAAPMPYREGKPNPNAAQRELRPPGEPPLFDAWVRYWKSQFTKHHRVPNHHWQPDHWERRLRREENYAEKWEYVWHNPVRKGLVARAEDWPYQGELKELPW